MERGRSRETVYRSDLAGWAVAAGPQERAGTARRPAVHTLRQLTESVHETFKGQLNLERHRGRTPGGVIARVMQRILALTAAI